MLPVHILTFDIARGADSGRKRTSSSTSMALKGYQIQLKDIELLEVIGAGSFGDVLKARWKGTVVVVKKLKVNFPISIVLS